ncbi:MAG: hypothetical protein HQ508_00875 [Candidatus Marinimicrobia bacterium]|nr:hypothetical protein [Candidatus Neomarinimicrobiota bacterium]
MLDIVKQRRWMMISIALLVILNLSLIANILIHERLLGRAENPRGGVEVFLERELKLTPEQSQAFADIRRKHFESTVPFAEALRDSMTAMILEAFTLEPNISRAMEIASNIGNLHRELDWALFQHFQQLQNICSPEQQERLKGLASELTHGAAPPPNQQRNPGSGPPPRNAPHPQNGAPPPPGNR